MLCVTSFTVVLTLGGGPRASTLEVSIYQALRFDFDPALAARLALLQIALCALLLAGTRPARRARPRRRAPAAFGRAAGRRAKRAASWSTAPSSSALSPSSACRSPRSVADGLAADFQRLSRDAVLWRAIGTSLTISLASRPHRSRPGFRTRPGLAQERPTRIGAVPVHRQPHSAGSAAGAGSRSVSPEPPLPFRRIGRPPRRRRDQRLHGAAVRPAGAADRHAPVLPRP